MTLTTRFAPSPTGDLHIGSARTAFFCYLQARRHHGQFILRIEDTDQERSTEAAVQVILDGMAWLGLEYDQGPIYQTDRLDRYHAVAQQLLASGHAYRCYCSKERLENMREQQMQAKLKPRYDGHCRELPVSDQSLQQPHVIRFKNPLTGSVKFNDLVKGPIEVANSELDDLVIIRSDNFPTYNFAVVIDDLDMQVTQVIRGDDHVNNTPRQINIFLALGAALPEFAHIPMILGSDGKKLSKRHGAVSVLQYRDDGYLPQALLNYLVRLGWSHGDQEIFSMAEMTSLFEIGQTNRAPAAFNFEKLNWLNQHYLKTLPPAEVVPALAYQFKRLGIDQQQGPDLAEIIKIQAERCHTLVEMAEKSRYFYQDITAYDEKAVKKNFGPDTKTVLEYLLQQFSQQNQWLAEPLHQVVLQAAEMLQLGLGKVAQPLRIAVTGGSVSPPMDITLQLLGKERVLARLQKSLELCS